MRRVVITGLGLITPLSVNLGGAWQCLIEGESGIATIPFLADDLPCKVAGHVIARDSQNINGLQISDFIPENEARRLDRFSIFAKIASLQAWKDSGINLCDQAKERIGVILGSGIGGLPFIEENAINMFVNNKKCSPFFIPASISNIAASHVAKDFGLMGPCYATVSACASGGHAIEDAFRRIREGDIDIMIAGGAEASICYTGIAGFVACRALATKFNDRPQEASRPWDKERCGFVMGEGAGILILENLEHAKKRGAKIYAEIVGYGSSCDAYHITAPHPEGLGAKLAMKACLKKAGISPEQVDYINAHGTSTQIGDKVELEAVQEVFQNNKMLYMSSNKSSIGHLLGAAAGVEAVFTVLSLRDGILPPTLNLHDSICEYNNINLVPHTAIEKKITYAMSNSFGFGGTNVSLLFKRFDG